jgi:hypothetical protein
MAGSLRRRSSGKSDGEKRKSSGGFGLSADGSPRNRKRSGGPAIDRGVTRRRPSLSHGLATDARPLWAMGVLAIVVTVLLVLLVHRGNSPVKAPASGGSPAAATATLAQTGAGDGAAAGGGEATGDDDAPVLIQLLAALGDSPDVDWREQHRRKRPVCEWAGVGCSAAGSVRSM